MIFGIPLEKFLAFSFIGAIVTTIGSLLAMIIKDYFLTRSFEKWKQKELLKEIYQKYKDPILLSAKELVNRLNEICKEYPTLFLKSSLLQISPKNATLNSQEDPYFQKYKLVSSLYRLCAFLGWLELYRQDITYLNSGEDKKNKQLSLFLGHIRATLADGHLNRAEDWDNWKDNLIFREEQRAIGEAMISNNDKQKTIIGYGKFCKSLNSKKEKDDVYVWATVSSNFLLDLSNNGKDFRKTRLQYLIVHLINLIEILEDKPISEELKQRRIYWKKELQI